MLDLEQTGEMTFRGMSPPVGPQRVYGGQVAGQALVAAGRTVDPARTVHSLHGYFVRPGDPAEPIEYQVENIRDGRSFSVRRSVALQHGKPIFFMSASFQRQEEGLDHQAPVPLDMPGAGRGAHDGRTARPVPGAARHLGDRSRARSTSATSASPAGYAPATGPADRTSGSGCASTASCPTIRCCTPAR